MTCTKSRILAPLFAAVLVLPACGGDSNQTTADKTFCNEIEKLDDLDFDTNIGSAVQILEDLAAKAPNDEIRDALLVIAPIFERLSSVDQNDANAMNEILEMMSSEEVAAASDVLDQYGTEVCGFEESPDQSTDESTP